MGKLKLLHVDTIDTPSLSIYAQLRDKSFSKDNSFIADSPKVVNLLLKTDIHVKSILATQEYYDEFEELLLDKKDADFFVADKKLQRWSSRFHNYVSV